MGGGGRGMKGGRKGVVFAPGEGCTHPFATLVGMPDREG